MHVAPENLIMGGGSNVGGELLQLLVSCIIMLPTVQFIVKKRHRFQVCHQFFGCIPSGSRCGHNVPNQLVYELDHNIVPAFFYKALDNYAKVC